MPLSEHEQRLLEQMERALSAEDPRLASTLRGSAAARRKQRILALSGAGFLLGAASLVVGIMIPRLVAFAVSGFVVMVICAATAVNSRRRRRPRLFVLDPSVPGGRRVGATAGRQDGRPTSAGRLRAADGPHRGPLATPSSGARSVGRHRGRRHHMSDTHGDQRGVGVGAIGTGGGSPEQDERTAKAAAVGQPMSRAAAGAARRGGAAAAKAAATDRCGVLEPAPPARLGAAVVNEDDGSAPLRRCLVPVVKEALCRGSLASTMSR